MPLVRLDGRRIRDWPSFHEESRRAFGFPDFYGRNLDAWIDCMSGVRDDDGMSAFVLGAGETLQIEVGHSAELEAAAPNILPALRECVDAVNDRLAEAGGIPALSLHPG